MHCSLSVKVFDDRWESRAVQVCAPGKVIWAEKHFNPSFAITSCQVRWSVMAAPTMFCTASSPNLALTFVNAHTISHYLQTSVLSWNRTLSIWRILYCIVLYLEISINIVFRSQYRLHCICFYIINFYFLCYISFYVACAFVICLIKYLLTYLLKEGLQPTRESISSNISHMCVWVWVWLNFFKCPPDFGDDARNRYALTAPTAYNRLQFIYYAQHNVKHTIHIQKY